MATTNVAAIQKLYVAYFNRPADPIGLDSWVKAMGNGATVDQIAAAFAGSDEYKATYAGLNDVQTIAAIYQNLFGREADVDGLKFWVGQLQAGSYTIDQAVQIISDSALASNNADGKIVANRVAAATAFTNAIDTTAEIIGYSGTAANNAAKGFLNGIKSDDSLTAAIAPAALDKSVASVIEQAQNAAGQKYVLTTGVDTLVGTAFNDTFTANTFTTSGSNATTLQSFDSIDGGAGTDTLNLFAASGFNNAITGTIKNVELINVVGSNFIGSTVTQTQLNAIATAQAAYDQDVIDLADAKAAQTTATARLPVVEQAKTLIDAAVNAVEVGASAAATYDAVLKAVNNTTTDSATKAAVIKALNDHYADIFASTPNSDSSLPATPATAQQVLDRAQAYVTDDETGATQVAVDAADKAVTDAGTAVKDADIALNGDSTATPATKGTTGALETAEGVVANNRASIDASKFVGSTKFTLDGTHLDVTGLGSQNVTFNQTAVKNGLVFNSTATAANVTLVGSSGTIGVSGSKVATINLDGSVASKGTVTLVDGKSADTVLNASDDTVKTLNLGLTSAATVSVAGLSALTTIAAAASTGALTIKDAGTKVSSITTGSGNDTVVLSTIATKDVKSASINTGAGNDDITVKIAASGITGVTGTVDAGAGNDTIRIENTGTVAMTIKAGAGNDTVIFADLNTVATADLVDGGDGTDTLAIGGAVLQAGDYVVLNETVTNFEAISFLGGQTEVDASRIAGYKTITLSSAEASIDNSAVTGVAADQTVAILAANHHDDVAVTAAGYVEGTSSTATVYGGNLTVNVTGTEAVAPSVAETFGIDLEAYASALKLAVTSTEDAAAYVTLTGDVKSATVTLTNASVENDDGDLVGQNTAEFHLNTGDANGKLTSLTLTGTGYAEVHNEQGSALATVNASGLTGQQWIAGEDGADAEIGFGNGLHYTSDNLSVVETITLGAGRDVIELAGSSYTKTDIVTGLSLVADASATGSTPTLDFEASDSIQVGLGETLFSNFKSVAAADLTGNSLNTVLRNLGLSSIDSGDHQFVFQYQGNTYVYVDVAADATAEVPAYGLSDNDVVVKLTGAIDLDLLKQALNFAD